MNLAVDLARKSVEPLRIALNLGYLLLPVLDEFGLIEHLHLWHIFILLLLLLPRHHQRHGKVISPSKKLVSDYFIALKFKSNNLGIMLTRVFS